MNTLARNSPIGTTPTPTVVVLSHEAVHIRRDSQMPIIREPFARTRFTPRALARTGCALALVVAVASACDKLGSIGVRRNESAGEVDRSFKPENIKSVKGVPAAEVRTAIAKRLGQPRPKPITEQQWTHA